MQQGLSLNHLRRWDEARAVLRQTIELAEAIGELDVLMRSLNILGFVDVELGDTSTVRPYHKRALEIAKTLGDPERIAFYGSNLGTISFASGDSTQAKEDLDRTVATVKQLGAAEQTALPLMWLGWVCVVQGKADQGLRDLEEAEAVGQNPSVKAYVAAVRALHALGEGQHGSAVRLLEPVVDASSDGWWGVLIFALPLLPEAYLAKGDSDRTERLVERTLALTQQIGTGRARADALLVRGKLATERGAWTEAAEDIEEALALMQLWPWSFSRVRLLYEYGVMLTRQGEPAVARQKLEQALTIFRRLEARPDVERTEQALAALS
jgi:tetratricopeptide (TPR) repeat protein